MGIEDRGGMGLSDAVEDCMAEKEDQKEDDCVGALDAGGGDGALVEGGGWGCVWMGLCVCWTLFSCTCRCVWRWGLCPCCCWRAGETNLVGTAWWSAWSDRAAFSSSDWSCVGSTTCAVLRNSVWILWRMVADALG